MILQIGKLQQTFLLLLLIYSFQIKTCPYYWNQNRQRFPFFNSFNYYSNLYQQGKKYGFTVEYPFIKNVITGISNFKYDNLTFNNIPSGKFAFKNSNFQKEFQKADFRTSDTLCYPKANISYSLASTDFFKLQTDCNHPCTVFAETKPYSLQEYLDLKDQGGNFICNVTERKSKNRFYFLCPLYITLNYNFTKNGFYYEPVMTNNLKVQGKFRPTFHKINSTSLEYIKSISKLGFDHKFHTNLKLLRNNETFIDRCGKLEEKESWTIHSSFIGGYIHLNITSNITFEIERNPVFKIYCVVNGTVETFQIQIETIGDVTIENLVFLKSEIYIRNFYLGWEPSKTTYGYKYMKLVMCSNYIKLNETYELVKFAYRTKKSISIEENLNQKIQISSFPGCLEIEIHSDSRDESEITYFGLISSSKGEIAIFTKTSPRNEVLPFAMTASTAVILGIIGFFIGCIFTIIMLTITWRTAAKKRDVEYIQDAPYSKYNEI